MSQAEPTPTPSASEAREQPVCPACTSERLATVGVIVAVGRLIKVTHRCTTCGTLSTLFRRAIG